MQDETKLQSKSCQHPTPLYLSVLQKKQSAGHIQMQRAPFCKHTYSEKCLFFFFWELSPFSHILNTGVFPSALVSIIPEWRTLTNSPQTKVCTKHLWKETVGCNLVSGNEYGCQAGEESVVILWRIIEADTNKMHKTNVERFWSDLKCSGWNADSDYVRARQRSETQLTISYRVM